MSDGKTKVSPWVIRRNFPFHLFLFDLLGTRLSTCTATVSTTNLLWSTNNCLQSFISNGNGNLAWPGAGQWTGKARKRHSQATDLPSAINHVWTFTSLNKFRTFPHPGIIKQLSLGLIVIKFTCSWLVFALFTGHCSFGATTSPAFLTIMTWGRFNLCKGY